MTKIRTTPTVTSEPTQANIEQAIQLSSRLARQRMVAQILASCEGTEEMVQKQNEYITKTFNSTHQP